MLQGARLAWILDFARVIVVVGGGVVCIVCLCVHVCLPTITAVHNMSAAYYLLCTSVICVSLGVRTAVIVSSSVNSGVCVCTWTPHL